MQQKREVKVLLADSFKELVQEKPVEKSAEECCCCEDKAEVHVCEPRFCPKCGAQVRTDAVFCQACGIKL